MKTPVTVLMIIVSFIAMFVSAFTGEVYHSIELACLLVLMIASMEPKK